MQNTLILDWAILAVICTMTAAAAVYWLTPRHKPAAHRAELPDQHLQNQNLLGPADARDPVFLFDDQQIIGASTDAQPFLGQNPSDLDWAQLYQRLKDRYPGFPKSQRNIQDHGPLILSAQDCSDTSDVVCEWIDGITRVHLRVQPDPNAATPALSQDLKTVQHAMELAPYPVWFADEAGSVNWFNAAYGTLCQKVRGKTPETPRPLFKSIPDKGLPGKRTRTSIAVANTDQRLWFDVSIVSHDAGQLCYAVDVNAVVDAEVAQRNFVQTLAKTFAQLSIGLAIFDRNRQLALFNPALIDLTDLPADFLSARPNLLSFFDRLRDQRMMPEPKNYGSWRQQMAELVAAAADGRYQETWSLPSGSVYSVRGRPHPDGAVAFLIEDITAEITLTRRFRSDLEMTQSILDRMNDALVVFSEGGGLIFSNATYRAMWEVDPENSFVQMSVLDATRSWQDRCQATPVLGEIRDFVASRENRADWWSQIHLKSGEALTCSVFPIQNGATMVSFARLPADAPLQNPVEPNPLARPELENLAPAHDS